MKIKLLHLINVDLSPAMLIFVNANPHWGKRQNKYSNEKVKKLDEKALNKNPQFFYIGGEARARIFWAFNIYSECFAVQI